MGRKTVLPAPPAEDLFALRAVHHVATTRSFSAAVRALGVAVSSVTRAVQRVEASLGARLFRRSTHGLSPTEAGRASLAAGRLVAVLPGWREAPPGDQPSLWAVHAANPGKDTLRRAFLALLAEATSR